MRRPNARPVRPRPPPDAASLHNAALAYLAKFSATEAGLKRVLTRRIDSWARLSDQAPEMLTSIAAQARAAIPALVARLREAGLLNDALFAEQRSRALARSGHSRRAIGAHLSEKGVPAPLAGEALPDNADHELAAALIHARKRRLGPWRRGEMTPELRKKQLANLARAGFSHANASAVLRFEQGEAEALITQFRGEI